MSAVGTLITMSAEGSGAAARDGQQHLLMLPGDPVATALNECLPRTANDVGHLQERATHLGLWRRLSFLLLRGQNQGVQRARGGAEMAFGQMQVDGGFFQVVMPQQQLNGSQIRTVFQQVGGETMPQGVGMDVFLLQASASSGLAAGVINSFWGNRTVRRVTASPGEQLLGRLAL